MTTDCGAPETTAFQEQVQPPTQWTRSPFLSLFLFFPDSPAGRCRCQPLADGSVKISGRVGRRTSETYERTTSADRRKRCGSACPPLPCKHFHSVVAIQVWWGRRFRLPKKRDFFTDPSASGWRRQRPAGLSGKKR